MRWAVSTVQYPHIFIIMTTLLEDLPVELVGTNVLAYLSLKDIVMLERACGSKNSHQAFIEQITYCAPVDLHYNKHSIISVLNWFAKRQCTICCLIISLPHKCSALHIKNLKVDSIDLIIRCDITTESLKFFQESNMGFKVSHLKIVCDLNKEVMEQLSICTRNVNQLTIFDSTNCMDLLSVDILSRWKLKIIWFASQGITTSLIFSITQTCTELTSIKLYSNNIDDAAVIAIAQHCPKLETLLLRLNNITWASLLALSERGLPLKELDIDYIPNIPTADIARRCSHALSCIRHLHTFNLRQNGQVANILLPSMTGLASVDLNYYCDSYIPLLTQTTISSLR